MTTIHLQPLTAPSCLFSIFNDQSSIVTQLCNFKIISVPYKSNIFPYNQYSVVLFNISQLSMRCQGNLEQVKPCLFCILHIKCNCEIHTPMFFLPQRVNRPACLKNYATFKQLRFTNLALIASFFNSSVVSIFEKHTPLLQDVQLNIPPLQFSKSTQILMKRDEQDAIDMRLATESIKSNKRIFQSITETLISDSFESFNWTIYDFAFAGTSTFCFLLLLGLICFLFVRQRRLTVLISTLALTQTADTQRIPHTLDFTVTKPPTILSDFFTLEIPTHLSIAIYTLIGVALMFIMITIIRQCFRIRTINENFSLVILRISSVNNATNLPWTILDSCPYQWNVQYSPLETPTVRLTGIWRPFITITWPTFSIVHTVDHRSMSLPSSVIITPYQAFRLRHLLRAQHQIQVVLLHANHYYILPPRN